MNECRYLFGKIILLDTLLSSKLMLFMVGGPWHSLLGGGQAGPIRDIPQSSKQNFNYLVNTTQQSNGLLALINVYS